MSEIHGAVGSYVVNALDPSELDEFEAHLAVCPTCSREVIEFCETAAELSLLATVSAPPPALRSSILSAISEVRVLPPILPPLSNDAEETAPRRASIKPIAATVSPAPVDELALRRQRRRTRVLSLAVAAVMVVALSLGGWVFSLVRDQQSQVADQAAETQLFAAQDVKVFTSTMKNGGKISFVVSKGLNKALFIGDNLPTTGPDQTYQLWTLQGQAATPDSLVAGGASRKQWFTGQVQDSTGLAVTIEPEAGSKTPTTPIQAAAQI